MSRLSLGLHALVAPGGSIRSVREALLAASRAAPEWERVSRVTCRVNCAYQRLCSHNAYVTDGMVLRVEQTGAYPEHGDGRPPDRNPRGCQKGMVYAHRNLDPTRIKYPMRRVGERGEGKWRRISWEEALSEIADAVIDVLTTEGTEAIVLGGGTQGEGSGVSDVLSGQALWSHLGVPMTDVNVEIGDDHQGATATFGTPFVCDSADNWYYADMILIWGGNPVYTNIPNYHFIAEARDRGAKVVAIPPDYSPSAIHADLWGPVNGGSDAALALSMCQVIVKERLYKEGFLVPDGFVITTEFFSSSKEKNSIKFSERDATTVYRYIDACCPSGLVAVRSSASVEDSNGQSFAGQFDSFLNVTKDQVLKAVEKCWQSLHNARSTNYAKNKNDDIF